MDAGYADDLNDVYLNWKNGNFENAARLLCRKTEIIASSRAGPFQVFEEDCFEACADNASCNEKCGHRGFCCSTKDKTSDRNCPAGKYDLTKNSSGNQ